ncbi:class I SAM-dependent methyltransferase [Patescibacteria group bacterium]|nr:class I SAM-dependent methyltransferase [Patescibacteria group bacterium]
MKKKINKEGRLTKKFYQKNILYEWNRLTKDTFHKLEFNTTSKWLKKYLPKKGSILDAGCGPGRYALALVKMGYKITLLDLVKENLEFSKKKAKRLKLEKNIKEVIEGSITDLSKLKSNSFDAVICLGGPLSHVHPASQRSKAVNELIRVAKPNSLIFISVMSKYGVLLAGQFGWPNEASYKKHFERIVFKGDDYRWHGTKGFCHFFTSQELEQLFKNKKVKIVKKIGLEGLSVDKKTTNFYAKKYPKAWKNWLSVHQKINTEPFVVDASAHILFILKKLR